MKLRITQVAAPVSAEGKRFISVKAVDATGTEVQFSTTDSVELAKILKGQDVFKRTPEGGVQIIKGTTLLVINAERDQGIEVETIDPVAEPVADAYTTRDGHVNEFLKLRFARGTEVLDI